MATFNNITLNILEEAYDREHMPSKAEVVYLGVSQILEGENKLEDVLGLYLDMEGKPYTVKDFVNKVRDEDKVPLKKREVSSASVSEDEVNSRNNDNNKENNKDSNIKVKKVFKALIPIALVGTVIVGYIHYNKFIKPNLTDDKDLDTGSNETGIHEYVEQEQYTSGGVETIVVGDPQLSVINGRSSSDLINMTDDEYLNALNSQFISCQANMPEISLFLEGNVLEGSKRPTSIQDTFRVDSPEYCVVEYFNQHRNEVENAAYDTRNADNVRLILQHHISEIYLFCNNQYGITINTSEGARVFYWSDLSYEARNAVLDVLYALSVALPHDYAINVNGVNMLPEEFASFYESQLATLTLVNPTNRR